jgi:hypothetical protein
MTSTVELRSPITVRPLTAHLGAESSDVKLAEDIRDDVRPPRGTNASWNRPQMSLSGRPRESIVGMPYAEGRALIGELNVLAVHPNLTDQHRWTPRERIVCDNRCVMHRATPYDPATQGRVVRRYTVLGGIPAWY